MSTGAQRAYPRSVNLNGAQVTLRLMTRADLERSVAFSRDLPEEDLMFLTVLAEADGRFVGYGSLSCSLPHWTRHLGEIRLLVGRDFRGKGLGRVLAHEIFEIAKAKGLQKLIARMAVEQKGAQQVFEHLGFHAEALLTDFVMDRNGRTHDLVVMTHDVTGLTE